eukprot:c13046_g1_i3.p1 GENE.c13046_g1_i3~~c13046_g1_i3.p1  ORF type:complete len:191 (-),score=58.37 c13046_g1_i3:8-580(-)
MKFFFISFDFISKACQLKGAEYTSDMIGLFDCRVGVYSSRDQALGLILWRAYDCGVNSVSDAVHRLKGKIEGAGAVVKEHTNAKLEWLQANHQLPLPPHQANGSFFVKVKRVREGTDPRTQSAVPCLRATVEQVAGNVLILAANDALFPPDDVIPEGALEIEDSSANEKEAEGKGNTSDHNSDGGQEAEE